MVKYVCIKFGGVAKMRKILLLFFVSLCIVFLPLFNAQATDSDMTPTEESSSESTNIEETDNNETIDTEFLTFDGFEVRTEKYNGLRSIFL